MLSLVCTEMSHNKPSFGRFGHLISLTLRNLSLHKNFTSFKTHCFSAFKGIPDTSELCYFSFELDLWVVFILMVMFLKLSSCRVKKILVK